TEELVEWIISTPIAIGGKFPVDELRILDIGSGSGCIPISLKRRLRKAEVWACDISEAALTVARRNAEALGTDVNFILLDFLNEEQRKQFPSFDIIVSNPPYVPEKDKEEMQKNVLQHEPHTALFVPDNDPLVFYKAIAEFGKTHLNKAGSIYCEIHENLGEPVTKLFHSHGYTSELKKDMQQKNRMIRSGLQ
ncbi:MAG: HemK/PrmC family methyltransferase, partial [Bacteroidota bacterium]